MSQLLVRFCVAVCWASLLPASPVLGGEVKVVDVQGMRLVAVSADAAPVAEQGVDIVVLGGSLGGVAATLSACDAGRSVILVEETDWLGGQATTQGVSALDENGRIETTGGTRTYQAFRTGVRDWYRRNTKLTEAARARADLDPGNSWVTRLGFEPKAAVSVIEEMLAPHRRSGRLSVLLRHKIVRARRDGRRVQSVDVVDLESGKLVRLSGAYFIDATELGEPLEVCGVDHVVGAESKEQTGEPHARDDGPHPECVQSFTYPFALRLRKDAQPPVARPPQYDHNLANQPYTLLHLYHDQRGWVRFGVFEHVKGSYGPFWTYRRLIDRTNFDDPAYGEDVAMINWPGNDYRRLSLIANTPEQTLQALREAKDLALGFCRWLQVDAPRDGGDGNGYPEMQLDAAVMGTDDGLSKYPYIRESRRIKALQTVVEQDVAAAFQQDSVRARHFADSVGIGHYGIDIHPNDAEKKLPPAATKPFQIPMGSLIPANTDNLLAGCKNIGVTHITNGCYRLHPVEWSIGEAAGLLAADCIRTGRTPAQTHGDASAVLDVQSLLVARGVPIFWYDDVGPADAEFKEAQKAPFTGAGVLDGLKSRMHYRPAAASQAR